MLRKLLVFILIFALSTALLQSNNARADSRADGTNRILATRGSSFAIHPDGSLWAWGENDQGQLGDGTSTHKHSPVHIMDDVIAVETNGRNTLAITSDNILWIWGRHGYQQPMMEGVIDQYVPTKLLDDVVSVSSNLSNVMAIRTDGSLWSAGDNFYGTLGTNERDMFRSTFEKVMDEVAAVSVGSTHVLAIRTNGSLWAWGSNYFGELGDGSAEDQFEPVHIMDNVAVISTSGNFSAAITTDNVLWGWGDILHFAGLFSDLDPDTILTDELHSPAPLWIHEGEINSVSVGSRGDFMMITLNDNSLWGYGSNFDGQLGDGSGVSQRLGVKIKDNVQNVVAGTNTVLAKTDDGGLWAWGRNDYGQVGDNSTTNRPLPVRIMDGFLSSGSPQILFTDSMSIEENGDVADGLYQTDTGGIELHGESPNDEIPMSPDALSDESESMNQESLLLLVVGITFVIILIAIVVVAFLLIKQRR